MAKGALQRQTIGGMLAGVAFMFPWSAQAQTQTEPTEPPAAQPTDIEDRDVSEIVVTAQRREERLIDVPIPITVISNETIRQRGATSLSDMQEAVPGLRIIEVGIASERIQLRGIAQFAGLATVGKYIDEFPMNNFGASGSADVRLLDMERVEVLRGPQPTLYGESSMGGTIRYIAARPDLSRVGGSARAEINSVRGGELGFVTEAVVNVPIVDDKVGVRLAASHERVGGWVDTATDDDVNRTNYTTLRGKLLLRPTSDLTIEVLGLHQNSDQDFKDYSLENGDTAQTVPSIASQKYNLGNVVASYNLGPITLLSTTGYLKQKGRSVDDSAPFYNTLFGFPLFNTAISDSRETLRKFNQEVRLTSNSSGPFQYLLGALYTHGKTTGTATGDTDPPAPFPGFTYTLASTSKSVVWAVYGSLSYDITDRLTVEAGGRYFHDKRSQTSVFDLPGVGSFPTDDQGSFHSFNPRMSIKFKTSADGIIYVDAAKGFRSGGFNPSIPGVQKTFAPEKLWSYEVGTKQQLFGRRLFVEAAVYYNDYKDIQAVFPVLTISAVAVTNQGKARGLGADLTLLGRLTEDLSVSGALGYNHVRFKEDSLDRDPGDPLDLVPDWTGSAAIDYTPRLSANLGLNVHADYNYSDRSRLTLRNIPPPFAPITFTDSRHVFNASVGLDFGRFEAYVFGRNLTDTRRIINPQFGGYPEPVYTKPRTIGIGLRGKL